MLYATLLFMLADAVLAIAWPVMFLAFVSQALLVMWGG